MVQKSEFEITSILAILLILDNLSKTVICFKIKLSFGLIYSNKGGSSYLRRKSVTITSFVYIYNYYLLCLNLPNILIQNITLTYYDLNFDV